MRFHAHMFINNNRKTYKASRLLDPLLCMTNDVRLIRNSLESQGTIRLSRSQFQGMKQRIANNILQQNQLIRYQSAQ